MNKQKFVPSGFSILSIEELERSEEELAEELVEDAVAQGATRVVITEVIVVEGLEAIKSIVDGQEAYILKPKLIQYESARFINIEPDNPTESASGHDWLSYIGPEERKAYVRRLSNENGFLVRRSDFDSPIVYPTDRYVGLQWRQAPIPEMSARARVCAECWTIRSLSGNCYCN